MFGERTSPYTLHVAKPNLVEIRIFFLSLFSSFGPFFLRLKIKKLKLNHAMHAEIIRFLVQGQV